MVGFLRASAKAEWLSLRPHLVASALKTCQGMQSSAFVPRHLCSVLVLYLQLSWVSLALCSFAGGALCVEGKAKSCASS